MEEIEKLLIEITKQELEKSKKEKIAPSKEVLDTITVLHTIIRL